jgi:hypothetical protein
MPNAGANANDVQWCYDLQVAFCIGQLGLGLLRVLSRVDLSVAMKVKPTPRWRVWAAGAIIGGALIYFTLPLIAKGPTLEQAGVQYKDALMKLDSRGVFGLLNEEEVRLSGLTKEKVQRFMDEVLGPRLQGVSQVGYRNLNKPGSGTFQYGQLTLRKGSREIILPVSISETTKGSRVVGMADLLLLSAELSPTFGAKGRTEEVTSGLSRIRYDRTRKS